jgi:eukaryotic-like serine/threonine-protein kinase
VTPGGTDASGAVREGDILAGKYRVERVLGIGGMGVVVAAHHLQLDEKVALKFLLPGALGNSEAVARFGREARAAVKIKSEHVARVIDVGNLANGAPYMVMEYLEGGDLDAWLKERGRLPIEQAVEFVLQASEAVAEAHSLGIIHRDLKPSNLFCIRRADGRLSVKVLDFGISKMSQFGGSGVGGMTHVSAIMGSPLYMSPEQLRSAKTVNAQTDIWALGIILFELFTGKPPFLADSLTELALRIISEPPPPIRDLRSEVPVALAAAVGRCLEKDLRHRFQNVAELAVALLPFAPERSRESVERISGILQTSGLSASVPALPPSPRSSGAPAYAGTTPLTGRPAGGSSRRKKAIVAASVIAGVVLLAAVSGAVFLGRIKPPLGSAQGAAAESATSSGATSARASTSPFPVNTAASDASAVVVLALPSTSPPATPAGPPLNPTTRPPAAPAGHPAGGPPPSTRPTPSARPTAGSLPPTTHKLDCNPPYVIDSDGNHQYKPECL